MKGFFKFLIVFAGILLLSALLAPVLYDFFQTFHPYKFTRIFNRLVMIGTLLAVAIFVRIRREQIARYGFDWKKESFSLFGTGFLTGMIALLVFTGVEVLAGNAAWSLRELSGFMWAKKLVGCVLTALLVGTLEEFFFRGFIFTSFREKLFRGNAWLAMILTSLFYSSVHFVNIRKPVIGADPGFMDSLKLIAAPFQSFADWHSVWPAAIGLFLFGMVLNYAVILTRSLYPSIGLHAGCIVFVRAVGLFVGFSEQNVFFWSSKKVYDGVIGWIFLLLIGYVLKKLLKKTVPAEGKSVASGGIH